MYRYRYELVIVYFNSLALDFNLKGLRDLNDNARGKGGKAERKIIIATIYIFFGIIILAMCLDLIQEVRAVFRRILLLGSFNFKLKFSRNWQ